MALQKQKKYYDNNTKMVKYNVGDYVLLKAPPTAGKFILRWNEPFQVTRSYSDVNYEIQHVENKKLKSIVHANRLKLYTPRKEETTKKETTNNPTTLQTSLSSIQTILLTLCLLQYINPTHPIYATVCDCNNVKIRGILDLESPYYCNNDAMEKQHSTRIPTSYTLITNQKPAATWKGWTCRQWTKTKKITGSFWIGSFDTIYSQETKLITPLECWRMVNDKKCGENNVQTGPTSISFTATPTGEGKWYAIKEYHTLNCVAEQITLRQERPDQPIESPFGLLNTTQQEGQYFINQNVIVWGERTTNHSYSQTLLKGKGYLEIPRTPEINNSSRLYDDIRQIEISFLNKPDKVVAATGFKVTGIPLTYLTFPAETTKILYETFKATINICLKNTNLIRQFAKNTEIYINLDHNVLFFKKCSSCLILPSRTSNLEFDSTAYPMPGELFDWYTRKQKLSTKKEKYYNRVQHSTSLTNLEAATH
ncbi:hypothetical protein GHT06_008877 [Daphnia sinensis]|uniref:Integrase p58-like C-terminal domain-containing protein n=1 Tax=Daphnia sinensis TaxID=1820382 RepID=A0AAD5Q2N3_9CRUS|nr:hypothetical protein GHT06_008877 [Daphnia sinensis]